MKYTDQDIQDYLDGTMPPDLEARFEIELNGNRALRESLDQYRSLYAILEDDKDIRLTSSFTGNVIKKTKINALGAIHFNLWHIFIAFFVVIVAINVSFYYVDTQQLVKDVTSSPQLETVEYQPFWQSLSDQIGSIEFNTPIPVLAFVILLLLFAIDRWIIHIRHKKVSFGG